MLEAILKLMLQHFDPLAAVPIAAVVVGFLLSIIGKSKAFFDQVLTVENARQSIPYILGCLGLFHGLMGIGAAYWFYFHTDIFSPAVDPNISHVLGREFVRGTDWQLIASLGLINLVLVGLAFGRHPGWWCGAARAFFSAILPTAFTVLLVAGIRPQLITMVVEPLSVWTIEGFAWWYAEVVLTSFTAGLLLTALWLGYIISTGSMHRLSIGDGG